MNLEKTRCAQSTTTSLSSQMPAERCSSMSNHGQARSDRRVAAGAFALPHPLAPKDAKRERGLMWFSATLSNARSTWSRAILPMPTRFRVKRQAHPQNTLGIGSSTENTLRMVRRFVDFPENTLVMQ
jgi:hypothetical protein